ncbi:MAG: glycoside hydrolase family 95 protein [Lachnospiraceae bacterium]|nr:glycoside hydrolase family 95 protein [Lachnospiraceae bacterium]
MSLLWYREPAKMWEEAMPLGNGRIGAMVFGNPCNERIQVNEESIWYGGPVNRINPDLKKYLPQIRELIFKGEISKAEQLMVLAMSGCPNSVHPYQTLGDIHIDFTGIKNVTNYRRQLDLEKALCTITFCAEGIQYTRELFVSKPADCMIMRISADYKGMISFCASLGRERFYDGVSADGMQEITLYGNTGRGGREFAMRLHARAIGGSLKTIGEHLQVENADEVILTFTADTDYHYSAEEKDAAIAEYMMKHSELPELVGLEVKSSFEIQEIRMQQGLQELLTKKMHERIVRSKQKTFEKLLEEHIADYSSMFGRVEFTLDTEESFGDIPTDERIRNASKGMKDISLSKEYFDFGRYLLISCSREDGLPANLQGIWNKDMTPPWDSKYTININAQMNYWLAENCNLSECHMPLFDLLEKLAKNGRKVARQMYGCRGTVAHHNTDYQGDAVTQDMWIPGSYWVMGVAWLCTHQWNHYEYTKDLNFLQKQFPVMCEAALFFHDFLVEKDGYLVTCPSVSPENTYILSSGEMGANGYGVTMDNQILRDLFTQCEKAYQVLVNEQALSEEVLGNLSIAEIEDIEGFINKTVEICKKLKTTQISKRGTIMEWQEDYEEAEPGHRHISHLYGLHPSEQITMDRTPELAKAAAKTLEYRLAHGGGHTGWSRAWIINHYAKLWDGEKAYEHMEQLLEHSTYPNMFDKHPPFQIDGNLGATAAMAEMIVQSTAERVVLLPALPKAWNTGAMKGLCIKGNARVDIYWEQGKLSKCYIRANSKLKTDLRYGMHSIQIALEEGEERVYTSKDFLLK